MGRAQADSDLIDLAHSFNNIDISLDSHVKTNPDGTHSCACSPGRPFKHKSQHIKTRFHRAYLNGFQHGFETGCRSCQSCQSSRRDCQECPICYETNDSIIRTDCGNDHFVCQHCWKELVKRGIDSCPLCRGVLFDRDIENGRESEDEEESYPYGEESDNESVEDILEGLLD